MRKMPTLMKYLMSAGLLLASLLAILWPHAALADPTPWGIVGRWRLIFADEFDAPLSKSRWTRCYWWDHNGCTNLGNKELEWYMPDNVIVADGMLVLRAKIERVEGDRGLIYKYTSGMVTSGRNYSERLEADRFATTYGYFEIRAKIPAGKGLWPAFWLLPSTQNSKPEIDIMEVLGDAPRTLEMHIHYRDESGQDQGPGSDATVPNMANGFHIYGLDWRRDAIIWYFDGKEKWRYTDKSHIASEPLYILLNLAVGGEWPGAPDSETVFPADFLIDYVRVWKRRR